MQYLGSMRKLEEAEQPYLAAAIRSQSLLVQALVYGREGVLHSDEKCGGMSTSIPH